MANVDKLYKLIAQRLLTQLQSSRFVVGQRMPTERELAVEYGVSRNTVREALIVLEARGWIAITHGRGVEVLRIANESPMTFDDSEVGSFKLIEARRLIEGEVCALAAPGVTPHELAHLEGLLEAMTDANREIAERADREFHLTIARATNNEAIIAVVQSLWDWRYWSATAKQLLVDVADNGMQDRIVEHRAILDALRSASAGSARTAMRNHLDRVRDHLLAAIEQEEIKRIQNVSSQRGQSLKARARSVDV
ncbi:FadR/GntR family transcriptional regulator [Sphingomonas sp. CFBP 8760]|uniref:FadR/GntR family transcriptional regulator n=1 Tax=Sphingomonas sp. CFBP 8760 TaxID=2775282 RepID=UPI0017805E34|nr:FadR/GntR family transcriptional regulator [Sphingomonas sp. CFBP 8760]MBD8548565.1 FadR family transcriptional regulator [Sphingomonas sp. CFBP 8760]